MSRARMILARARNTDAGGLPPSFTSAPTISGTPTVGSTLTASPGTASPDGTRSYVWYASGVSTGATGTTYVLGLGDVGKTISVQETATNTYGSDQEMSASTAAVTNPGGSGTVYFGEKTRRGFGGYDLGSAVTITGGNTGSVWAVDASNRLVLAGTYGAAPPALSFPYTLTLSNGQTLTVQGIANAYSVRPIPSTDSGSTNQINASLTSGTVNYGDEIILRDGTTFGLNPSGNINDNLVTIGITLPAGSFSVRSGGPSAPTDQGWSAPGYQGTTVNHAGWVTIRPETPLGATITRLDIDCKNRVNQYIKVKDVKFTCYNTTGTSGSAYGAVYVRATSGTTSWAWVAVQGCDISSRLEVSNPTSSGMASGIVLPKTTNGSSNYYIYDNYLHDIYNGIVRSGSVYEITGNDINYCFNDAVKGQCFSGLVSWNLCRNKTFIGAAHGDYFQEQWAGVAAGTYVGTTYIGNIMFLGDNGGTATHGGQGIFIADAAAGVNITDIVIKGNLFVDAINRGITVGNGVDSVVEFNTIVQDQYTTYPSNNPKIYFGGTTGGSARYNVIYNGSTTGATTMTMEGPITPLTADVGNMQVTPSDYPAAYNSPVYGPGRTPTQIRQGFTSKTGGPLDLSPVRGLGVGTAYVDFVNRTTNFPV